MSYVRDVLRPKRRPSGRWPRDEDSQRGGIDWGAAGWAGLGAGVFLLAFETLVAPLVSGGTPWDAMRRMASITLGESALQPATPFTGLTVLAAFIAHIPLSLLYARVIAGLVERADLARSLVLGTAFGLVLYAVNYYGFTEVFPWFSQARGWPTLLGHAAYGALAAWLYKRLEGRRT